MQRCGNGAHLSLRQPPLQASHEVRRSDAMYQELLVSAAVAADQADLRTFQTECLAQDADQRLVSPSVLWRRSHGDLQAAGVLADHCVLARARLSPHG